MSSSNKSARGAWEDDFYTKTQKIDIRGCFCMLTRRRWALAHDLVPRSGGDSERVLGALEVVDESRSGTGAPASASPDPSSPRPPNIDGRRASSCPFAASVGFNMQANSNAVGAEQEEDQRRYAPVFRRRTIMSKTLLGFEKLRGVYEKVMDREMRSVWAAAGGSRAVNLSTLVRDTLGSIFYVVFFGSVALPRGPGDAGAGEGRGACEEEEDDPRLARFHHMLKETLDLFHHAQEHFVEKYSKEIDAEKLFEMHGVTRMDDILVTQIGEAFHDLVLEYRNVYRPERDQDGTDCALVPVLWASGGMDDREISATLVNALIAAAEAIGSVALNLLKQLLKKSSDEDEERVAGEVEAENGLEGGRGRAGCAARTEGAARGCIVGRTEGALAEKDGECCPTTTKEDHIGGLPFEHSAFRTALLAELQEYNASRSASANKCPVTGRCVTANLINKCPSASGDRSSSVALDKLPRLDAFLREGLRLFAPATMVQRVALSDDANAGGITFDAGVVLCICPPAMHLSAKMFPTPKFFDPGKKMNCMICRNAPKLWRGRYLTAHTYYHTRRTNNDPRPGLRLV